MRILGIETSCDETAIAIVEDGRHILSNVISSQVELHSRYGGIVPEVASRQHLLELVPIYLQALEEALLTPDDLDAVAVTMGPGLAGSLLCGVNFAKGLAFGRGIPFLGINHLEGHIFAYWLEDEPDPAQEPGFPLLCLITSGGHTDLILMTGLGQYARLGQTRDDAAGEAFDKAGRVLGLGFPGGPEVERVARGCEASEVFPRPWLRGTMDFSFSGLKTAVLRRAQERGVSHPNPTNPDKVAVSQVAAGFQEAVVDVLVGKTLEAAERYQVRGVLIGGGVAANSLLRQEMRARSSLPVLVPRPALCTDNGAMVAACAYYRLSSGEIHNMGIDVVPHLRLG